MIQHWEQVYDVLAEECGSHPRDTDAGDWLWRQFIAYMERPERWYEFRFMGSLGFGGKFHRDEQYLSGPHYYVSCYPENRTPEGDAAIERANERLAALARLREETRA